MHVGIYSKHVSKINMSIAMCRINVPCVYNSFSSYLSVKYKLVYLVYSIAYFAVPFFFLSSSLSRPQFGLSGFSLNVS